MTTVNIDDFSPQSRVWVYQGDRPLSKEETEAIDAELGRFVQTWAAHGSALKAWGKVCYNRFIVLLADETQHKASGCSVDASVRFLKDLERRWNIGLFDRLTLVYRLPDGAMANAHVSDLPQLYAAGDITDDTIVFDNLVGTKQQFEQNWEIPLGKSKLLRLV